MIRYELNPLVSNQVWIHTFLTKKSFFKTPRKVDSSDLLFEDLGTIRRKEPFILAWFRGSLFVEIQGLFATLLEAHHESLGAEISDQSTRVFLVELSDITEKRPNLQ